MNTKENKEFLKKLLDAPSPSGYEFACNGIFLEEVSKYHADRPYFDKIGNMYFKCGNGPVKILLSGHIDEVYAVVVNISDDGIISIGNAGGIDRKDLIGSNVVLLDDNCSMIEGIVIKVPLHIEAREETYDKISKFEDFRIDI